MIKDGKGKICFFVSDLHGHRDRYEKLFTAIAREVPDIVFMGGDILPAGSGGEDFINKILIGGLQNLKERMTDTYPHIFIIPGNDDPGFIEEHLQRLREKKLGENIHFQKIEIAGYQLIGYSYIPPSPFLLKDWEKYDLSRFTDPGCISPEDGFHTKEVSLQQLKWSTIKDDLQDLVDDTDMNKTIFLFHSPPYKTKLDRAALDDKTYDGVPLDLHIGSVAIKKMIEKEQPFLTLHGHVHESAALTGAWKDKIGKTICFSAAHDGRELALIRFELKNPDEAERILI